MLLNSPKIVVHINRYTHKAQSGIGGGNSGSKRQMLIDQSVAKDARSKRTNLAMAWIDYQESLRFSAPFVDTRILEAIQDLP